jgi:HD-GYP domain-containing protein (c-di-GMP phosphodiesterase class II)
MRQHPQFAFNLLKNIPYLSGALDVAFCHHERWDGTGYPRKLRGEEIPFSARIFAVIDVWDALTHDRPYRPAWSEEEALNYIMEQAGTQFDPQVVNAFVQMQKDGLLRQTTPLPVHFTLD